MKAALLAVIALALAGAAQAQTAEALMAAPLRATATATGVGIDLASPRASFAPRYAHTGAPRIPGVARTSVDHRFDDDAGVVGSLGFLCGLEPGAERKGAAAARGYDPTGRFVGAKLKFAFR